jgi:hypothetical protein
MGTNVSGAPDAELLNEGSSYALRLPANRIDLDNLVRWDTGRAITAGQYEVGRDADGTNQLHFNVPTGAGFEFSINDSPVLVSAQAGRQWGINGAPDLNGYGANSVVLSLRGSVADTETGVEIVGKSITGSNRVGSLVITHDVGGFQGYVSFEGYRDGADNDLSVAIRAVDGPSTTRRLYWTKDGNLGLESNTFGTDAKGVFLLKNSTPPTAGPADSVQFYSTDESAGHTIPSFYCEGTNVIATGQADSASSVRVKMRINGTVVTLLAV